MSQEAGAMRPYIGRGILVFFSGMALAGISFVVEQMIIKAAQSRS